MRRRRDPASSHETSVDILIVGGGVTGCALTYYLARGGAEVLLIERDDLNSGGSGANAGSLHLQLPAPFFNGTPRDRLLRAAATLIPLSVAAAAEWQRLSRDLGGDIEFHIGGGLMVAETEEQLALLEDKVGLERSCGLETELLRGDDIHGVAPYLSPRIVGAAFCPSEGKVNPLAATIALAEAAVEAGGRIRRGVELRRLDARGAAFVAETSAGAIQCRLVVDAAGSSAGRIAAMVGAELPVTPRPQNMIVTEAAPATIPHLVQHIGRRLTLKQMSNGNIVIGGGLPGRPTADGVAVMRESFQASLNTALTVVPMIGGLRLLRSWASEALITDGNPILGEHPPVTGFHYAVPSSSGYTTGPISARLLAEVLLGDRPPEDLGRFSIARFSDPDW